jgi:hypothetical protein
VEQSSQKLGYFCYLKTAQSSQKLWLLLLFKKSLKENNHPIWKQSPNLVTLPLASWRNGHFICVWKG